MPRKNEDTKTFQPCAYYRCPNEENRPCRVMEYFANHLVDALKKGSDATEDTVEMRFRALVKIIERFLPCWRCRKGVGYLKHLNGRFGMWEKYILTNAPYSHADAGCLIPSHMAKPDIDSFIRAIATLEKKGMIERKTLDQTGDGFKILGVKFKKFPYFLIRLHDAKDSMSKYLKKHLSSDIQQKINNYQNNDPKLKAFRENLAREIAAFLQKATLSNKKKIVSQEPLLRLQAWQKMDRVEFNKKLLKKFYPGVFEFTDTSEWGREYPLIKLTPLGDCVRQILQPVFKAKKKFRWEEYRWPIIDLICLSGFGLLEEVRNKCLKFTRDLADLVEDPFYYECENFYRKVNPEVIYGDGAPIFSLSYNGIHSVFKEALRKDLDWDCSEMRFQKARIVGNCLRLLGEMDQDIRAEQCCDMWLGPVVKKIQEYLRQIKLFEMVVQAIDKAKLEIIQNKGLTRLVAEARAEIEAIAKQVEAEIACKRDRE